MLSGETDSGQCPGPGLRHRALPQRCRTEGQLILEEEMTSPLLATSIPATKACTEKGDAHLLTASIYNPHTYQYI